MQITWLKLKILFGELLNSPIVCNSTFKLYSQLSLRYDDKQKLWHFFVKITQRHLSAVVRVCDQIAYHVTATLTETDTLKGFTN